MDDHVIMGRDVAAKRITPHAVLATLGNAAGIGVRCGPHYREREQVERR